MLKITKGKAIGSTPNISLGNGLTLGELTLPSISSDKTVSSHCSTDSFAALASLKPDGRASSNSPARAFPGSPAASSPTSSGPSWSPMQEGRASRNSPAAGSLIWEIVKEGRATRNRPSASSPVWERPEDAKASRNSPAASSLIWETPKQSTAAGNSPFARDPVQVPLLEGMSVRNSPANDMLGMSSSSDANSSALDELRKWTWECSSLRAFLMIGNPVNFASYTGQRLDGKPGTATNQLDEAWYQNLLVRVMCA